MRFTFKLMIVLGGLLLQGCSQQEKYVEKPVEDLYNKALDLLQEESYLKAAQAFDEVERQHPYSYWATKAQLMAAYSYYKSRAYEKAIESLDAFIQLHPGHEDIAYAYYLKGFSYYHQLSIVERDQKMTELALEALNEVTRRFPHSPYARDARLKIQLTKDHLAGKDMQVGRFYQRSHLPLAAIYRFNNVVDNYQGTTHIPEALHRLVECYLSLGMYAQARRSAVVLGHNYPGSDWYQDSYNLLYRLGAASPEATSVKNITQGLKLPERSSLDEDSSLPQKDLSAETLEDLKKKGRIILLEGEKDSNPPPSVVLNQRPSPKPQVSPDLQEETPQGDQDLQVSLSSAPLQGEHDPSLGLAEMKDLVVK